MNAQRRPTAPLPKSAPPFETVQMTISETDLPSEIVKTAPPNLTRLFEIVSRCSTSVSRPSAWYDFPHTSLNANFSSTLIPTCYSGLFRRIIHGTSFLALLMF